jgi:GNAT superfamily N-acetyltransferase
MTGVIRGARADDYDTFVVLRRELSIDDPTPTPERFASHILPRMLVYERRREVLGFVTYDKLAANGYIRGLAVAPQARRAGIATALMTAAAHQLRARGVTTDWHLNVKADNAPALQLYERFGMKVLYSSVALRFAWANIDRLPSEDSAVTVRPVADAAVPDIERALGIVDGRLELARSRGRGVTLQLRDERLAPVGVACFDPSFPGAFPFRVARPTLASLLLDALAPHVRTGDLDLQIIVEHDDALADTLIAAGAVVRMRLLHLAGPLPPPPEEPEGQAPA